MVNSVVVFYGLFYRSGYSVGEGGKYTHFGDRYAQFVHIELWSKMSISCE